MAEEASKTVQHSEIPEVSLALETVTKY